MFHIHALRDIYTYVLNKYTLIKYAFITYLYSPTRFGHFCDHHQSALHDTDKTATAQAAQIKPLSVTMNISSTPYGHIMSDYVFVKNR
jgi:hypothetical protein